MDVCHSFIAPTSSFGPNVLARSRTDETWLGGKRSSTRLGASLRPYLASSHILSGTFPSPPRPCPTRTQQCSSLEPFVHKGSLAIPRYRESHDHLLERQRHGFMHEDTSIDRKIGYVTSKHARFVFIVSKRFRKCWGRVLCGKTSLRDERKENISRVR